MEAQGRPSKHWIPPTGDSPGSSVRIRLARPVSGVRLEERPGSKLRDATGTLVDIPADAIVELEGVAAPSGLINVIWEGHAYSVFHEDLKSARAPRNGKAG
jgi:hypothetical protein